MTRYLTTEYVATDRLRLHPDNPRRGNVAEICNSLEAHGQYRPIVVNRPTMEVLTTFFSRHWEACALRHAGQ